MSKPPPDFIGDLDAGLINEGIRQRLLEASLVSLRGQIKAVRHRLVFRTLDHELLAELAFEDLDERIEEILKEFI
jgi:hypothetical protein